MGRPGEDDTTTTRRYIDRLNIFFVAEKILIKKDILIQNPGRAGGHSVSCAEWIPTAKTVVFNLVCETRDIYCMKCVLEQL